MIRERLDNGLDHENSEIAWYFFHSSCMSLLCIGAYESRREFQPDRLSRSRICCLYLPRKNSFCISYEHRSSTLPTQHPQAERLALLNFLEHSSTPHPTPLGLYSRPSSEESSLARSLALVKSSFAFCTIVLLQLFEQSRVDTLRPLSGDPTLPFPPPPPHILHSLADHHNTITLR